MLTKLEIQDTLIDLIDCLNESVYQRYTNGEIGSEEFEKICDILRRWSEEMEELSRFLDVVGSFWTV